MFDQLKKPGLPGVPQAMVKPKSILDRIPDIDTKPKTARTKRLICRTCGDPACPYSRTETVYE